MGPLISGFVYELTTSTGKRVRVKQIKLDTTGLPIEMISIEEGKMSPEELVYAKYENGRRAYLQEMLEETQSFRTD
jgi:hypothetical protein